METPIEIVEKHSRVIRRSLQREFSSATTRRTGKTNRKWRPKIRTLFGDPEVLEFTTTRGAFVLNHGLKSGAEIVDKKKNRTYTRKRAYTKAEGFIQKALGPNVEKMAGELGDSYADLAYNLPPLQQ